MTTTLTLRDTKAYTFSLIFIAGNIILPQLCHIIPNGGLIFLPIYFFTLIGAYRYGLTVGLLTAIGSPLVNHLLFGMPPASALVAILVKSVMLAACASFLAERLGNRMFLAIVLSVVGYQLLGGAYELAFKGWEAATQDVRIGLPGILIQVFFGYKLLSYLHDNYD